MTPKEKVIAYVDKNLSREKDKWDSGMNNKYYEWQEVKEELFSESQKVDVKGYLEEIQRLKRRLKAYGLPTE